MLYCRGRRQSAIGRLLQIVHGFPSAGDFHGWICADVGHVPTLSTLSSILGLMILYQRYIHQISHLEPSKLPVRQKGCVNDALGVKYFSMVARWVEGGLCVSRWIIWGISVSGCRESGSVWVMVWRERKDCWEDLRGSSISERLYKKASK